MYCNTFKNNFRCVIGFWCRRRPNLSAAITRIKISSRTAERAGQKRPRGGSGFSKRIVVYQPAAIRRRFGNRFQGNVLDDSARDY